ncbi:hypothetical protein EDC44_12110 [Cricetibacter osteomyelitidis]|uniref:Uncharacterized protein n=1 Tax=Cricetibacter osteomyelitidis TaxID=1521931 RepID=A0A4R2SSL2_9PAST|nr:hypothetical protein [Cricetibacter osteomyelitidis]TCP93299.1 hypothetical protein EDC44_12110 [Cricetibacter osteomyelitidis]
MEPGQEMELDKIITDNDFNVIAIWADIPYDKRIANCPQRGDFRLTNITESTATVSLRQRGKIPLLEECKNIEVSYQLEIKVKK